MHIQYSCENITYHIWMFAKLVERPYIIGDLAVKVNVYKGETRSMECRATGQPPPTYRWLVNGESIENFDERRYRVSKNGEQLTVNNIMLIDQQIYQCQAENDYGTDTKSYNMTVIGKPKINAKNTTSSKTGMVNGSIELACAVQRNSGEKTSNVQILWFKNGIRINPELQRNMQIIDLTDGRYVLRVSPLRSSDSGRYKCVVKNPAGHDEIFIDVLVNSEEHT